MKKILKRKYLLPVLVVVLFLVTGLFSIWCNYHIRKNAETRLYDSVEDIPVNTFGLVPGTSMKLNSGRINQYFKYRMEAAASLYKEGKIKHIIVSGDNHSRNYNEPADMKNYLVKLGVPQTSITLDYAGFRTFDSMIRAREIFGVKKLTVISQKFHSERALFIADHYGMEAIGYNAKDPYITKTTKLREFFAKVNAVLEVYLFSPEPAYLGKKEPIVLNQK